jgi:hypothetical protein
MPIQEVRSPNSLTSDQHHPRRGESPGAYSSPSNPARADCGHLVRSPGKGPAVRRPDANNVVGGRSVPFGGDPGD